MGSGGFRILFLFVFLWGISAGAHTLQASCHKPVKKAYNLGTLIERIPPSAVERPTFYRLSEDYERSRTWKGVPAPRMIQDLLPPGLSLIDHELIDRSEPGVVKDPGSGEFVTLRLDWQGQGTNLGVTRSALVDNAERSEKLLVRKNARAVIVFMHGGGTRTTGHHVAINLMNHFSSLGVDVLSWDQPWHGEGSRELFRSAKDYFEWMRSMLRTYVVPAGVPLFLAGHSMGGEFADFYRRLYPGDNLVKAVIPLSAVVGRLPAEEVTALERKVTTEDAALGDDLVRQNKVSHPSMVFESLFSTWNSWLVSPEAAQDYLPALYIWGAGDFLYAGKEALVEKYLKPIPRTEIRIYDRRYDLTEEKDVTVGHMIFDHHRPGTNFLETFADMGDFIGKQLGSPLERPKTHSEKTDLIKKVAQTYANVLAFRVFAKDVRVSRKVASVDKMAELQARLAAIDPKSAEAKRLVQLRAGYFIPEGEAGALGRQWAEESQALKREILQIKAKKDTVKKELDELRLAVRKSDRFLDELAKNPESAHESLKLREREIEKLFEGLKDQNHLIGQSIDEYIRTTAEPMKISAFLQAQFDDYHRMMTAYLDAKLARDQLREDLILSGALGLEYRRAYILRYGESRVKSAEAPQAGSLEWNLRSLQRQMDEWDQEIFDYEDRIQLLQANLTNTYSEGIFRTETMSLEEILNRPFADWESYQSFIRDAWSRWQLIWKERPPSTKMSLY